MTGVHGSGDGPTGAGQDGGPLRGTGPLRLTLLTAAFSDTQIFRTLCLHQVAQHLGHCVDVVTTEPGEVVSSLAGTDFARSLRRVSPAELAELVADGTDVLCTVKALEVSLGQGARLCQATGTPLLADIDDPDIEVRTYAGGTTPARSAYRLARSWRTLPGQLQLARTARRAVTSVSNPVLQRHWGGHLVPHARVDRGPGAPHVDRGPQMAFVGTVKGHKGIELLRAATAALQADGWRLLVTAPAPADARPWEDWVGPLDGTLDAVELTAAADVVVLPSEDFSWGKAQLPLKLIDAMLLGRAVAVSDVGPLPWAVGDAGTVFPASSLPGLVEAIRPLRDAQLRARLGARAREIALERFTLEAVAPAFQRALAHARMRAEAVPAVPTGSPHQ